MSKDSLSAASSGIPAFLNIFGGFGLLDQIKRDSGEFTMNPFHHSDTF